MTEVHVGVRTVRMPDRPGESPWSTLGPPLEPPYELSGDLPDEILRGADGARLRNLYPFRVQNRYDRTRTPREVPSIVIENAKLRAEFLPSLGGRLWSLVDLERGVELLHSPDEIVFANLALRNAWFAGGIEFNIGTRGHAGHTCEDVHAAVVRAADGTPGLRFWGYERVHGLVFQIDVTLPRDGAALVVRVRVRNPGVEQRPLYWWSNAAVPQTARTRVLTPGRVAYATDYDGGVSETTIDTHGGVDCSWPERSPHASDFFFAPVAGATPWVAAVDEHGDGLLMASDAALPGRKLFCWGSSTGSAWWQEWLTPGGPAYAEIQAGVTTTQFETRALPAGGVHEWTEVYGNARLGPQSAATPWVEASSHAASAARAIADAAAAGEEIRDAPLDEIVHVGTGWGALAALLDPGISDALTPFPASDLAPAQAAWEFIARGEAPPEGVRDTAGDVRGAAWEAALDALVENDEDAWLLTRAAVLRHAAGDLDGAEPRYRRALARGPHAAAHRGLGLLLEERERDGTAHLGRAVAACPADAELTGELVGALLARGRAGDALGVLEGFPVVPVPPRLRVQRVQALLAVGGAREREEARRELEGGIEIVDVREGEVVFAELWAQVSDDPLPAHYDTRLA